MNESIKWEWIEDGFLCRARVPWGWIVKASENVFHPDRVSYPDQSGIGYDYRISICFVFDPFHWWKIGRTP